jgi:hypothetical protein
LDDEESGDLDMAVDENEEEDLDLEGESTENELTLYSLSLFQYLPYFK